jgi:tRNA dimethylallyltransferase
MTRRPAAIVGATATGKTTLAVALAQAIHGEIINADSRQMYRGMDIGTAKPTPSERAAVRHWIVDCVDPDEQFTLATFLDLAHEALSDVIVRDLMPIVVGGTGQYVWALLEGWRVPRVAPNDELRAELEALAEREGPAPVLEMLRDIDPASAERIDQQNVRRLIRAIEVTRETGVAFSEWQQKSPPAEPATIIGLELGRDDLYRRIDARVDAMIADGLVAEVQGLLDRGYGCDLAAMNSIGYQQICEYLRGECTLDAAVERIKTETHRLARMQHTWFRRDDARIRWLDARVPDLLERVLALVIDAA